jgi:hypothetical protein
MRHHPEHRQPQDGSGVHANHLGPLLLVVRTSGLCFEHGADFGHMVLELLDELDDVGVAVALHRYGTRNVVAVIHGCCVVSGC